MPLLRHNECRAVCCAAGGWFHTGDQGFLDAEGYLTLTGRLKELIKWVLAAAWVPRSAVQRPLCT